MRQIADEDDDFGSNSLEQYGTYEKVEVQNVTANLTAKASALIDGIARIYTSVGSTFDDEFITSIKAVETDALVSMLKQVKYAEHMLDSMMKRLDNGGFADKDIYDQIKDMQHHVIKINLEVSKYTRLLPEYFKFTESDVSGIQSRQNQEYTSISQGITTTMEATVMATPITGPQFGTKGFLEQIEAISSMENIDAILNNEPEQELEFDPKDIQEEDEIFDDELGDLGDGNLEDDNLEA